MKFVQKIGLRLLPVAVIVLVVLVFLWKVVLRGDVLVATDLMVGAYYPWRDTKWGYEVAVPYKNPLLSDTYSQFFVWKKLIADSFQKGEWPLWNQFSYSGYPLLGNLHSGALYPLNLLMVWLPFNLGWNLYCIFGMVLSCLSMYLFLLALKKDRWASVLGGIAYGMSGYAISWMEFATAGQSMIWLPLMFLVVVKYFERKNVGWLLLIAPLILMLILVGHFQITMYALLATFGFFLYKQGRVEIVATIRTLGICILGILMASIVLLPSFELMQRSVREKENYLGGINNGLAPIGQLITMVAPDFFGNPSTANYWGFLNYHELLMYGGVIMALAWVWSWFNFKKIDRDAKYFAFLMLISIILMLDTPIGRLVYWLKIPGLAASMAGRIAILFVFGGGVMVVEMVEKLKQENVRQIFRYFAFWIGTIVLVGGVSILIRNYYLTQSNLSVGTEVAKIMVGVRNLMIPSGILLAYLCLAILLRKKKIFVIAMGIIMVADIYKFGWKYLPFSDSRYVFPKTDVTGYLSKDWNLFRVEKEHGPLMSPNTWTMYGLMSPSGYDPMAPAEYTKYFNEKLNDSQNNYSRYAEINNYSAKNLGKYNTKYLLALKDEYALDDTGINKNIDQNDWEKVFEAGRVVVFKNKYCLPRVFIEGEGNFVRVKKYTANKIVIDYESTNGGKLVILDSWYPGWQAKVNGNRTDIEKYNDVFRQVKIERGEGRVTMEYSPTSFWMGMAVSVMAILVWIGLIASLRKLDYGALKRSLLAMTKRMPPATRRVIAGKETPAAGRV